MASPPPHALKVAAAVTFGLVAAVALGEIGLRVVEATWEAAAPRGVVRSAQGVVLSPKELHTQTPAGKRIRPNLAPNGKERERRHGVLGVSRTIQGHHASHAPE